MSGISRDEWTPRQEAPCIGAVGKGAADLGAAAFTLHGSPQQLSSSMASENGAAFQANQNLDTACPPDFSADLRGQVYAELADAVIETSYSAQVGTLKRLEKIEGGAVNTTYLVASDRGKFVLRIYTAERDLEQIALEHEVMTRVRSKGMHTVPELVRTNEGETVVSKPLANDDSAPRMFCTVFEYIECGHTAYTWKNPPTTDAEIMAAGRTLAQYHSAVYREEFIRRLSGRGCSVQGWVGVTKYLADLLQHDAGPHFLNSSRRVRVNDDVSGAFLADDELRIRRATWVQKCIAETKTLFQQIKSLRGSVLPLLACHGDFHPGNLKWGNSPVGVVGLFDFDHLIYPATRLEDVAIALSYFCREPLRVADTCTKASFIPDHCRWFLRAYHEELYAQQQAGRTALDGFSDTEVWLLPIMVRAVNVRLLSSILERTHGSGAPRSKVDEAIDEKGLRYIYKAASWIDKSNHRQVLRTIADESRGFSETDTQGDDNGHNFWHYC